MKVSRTNSGRLIVVMTKEERAKWNEPLVIQAVWPVSLNKPATIVLKKAQGGCIGTQRHDAEGSWAVEFHNEMVIKKLKPFGTVAVETSEGPDGQLVLTIPANPPAPSARPKKRPPAPEPMIINNHAAPLALPDLVKAINAARQSCPDIMVFSTDGDGYLRVMVEYGRG